MQTTNNAGFKPTRITFDLLKEWVPEKNQAGIRLYEAWKIISKYYCGTLISRGVCPQLCAACQGVVGDLFPLTGADNAEAVLTYRARSLASRHGDELLQAQRQAEQDFLAQETRHLSERDRTRADYLAMFQREEEKNPFLELARQYEDDERKT